MISETISYCIHCRCMTKDIKIGENNYVCGKCNKKKIIIKRICKCGKRTQNTTGICTDCMMYQCGLDNIKDGE